MRGLLAAVVWCVFAHHALPAILYVPDHFARIQDAIDASANGDTVFVKPGLYSENLDFKGKAISLLSTGGAAVTFLDGGKAGSVVTFQSGEGADSILSGFTIRNGSGTEKYPGGFYGGGIYCGALNPTIKNCIIRDNEATDGGAVHTVEGFRDGLIGWPENDISIGLKIILNIHESIEQHIRAAFQMISKRRPYALPDKNRFYSVI